MKISILVFIISVAIPTILAVVFACKYSFMKFDIKTLLHSARYPHFSKGSIMGRLSEIIKEKDD